MQLYRRSLFEGDRSRVIGNRCNYFPLIRISGWIGFSMIDFYRLRMLSILNGMKIKEDNRNFTQQKRVQGLLKWSNVSRVLIKYNAHQDEKCRFDTNKSRSNQRTDDVMILI